MSTPWFTRSRIEVELGRCITKHIESQEEAKKSSSLWHLYNHITWFISHEIKPENRAQYQLATSKLFEL